MIVFCQTCKGRSQHVKLTLPKNITDNPGDDCKFVVLDYNSDDDLLEYLKSNHQKDIDSGRLIIYSYPAAVGFKMSHAKNMAHRCGILEGGDILCNLDADNFTTYNFIDYINYKMENTNTYLWAVMQPGILPRGISGRIVITKDAFLKTGGYNQKYETWSPDDKDLNARLSRLGYIGKEIDECYLRSVPHNDKMRFREYKHAKTNMTEESFDLSEDDTTVTNFGKIGLGTVFKNFDFSNPIELKPIPTRIFGIGMHKTGTTSLHHALEILGYDSAHWLNAHWAKAIWQEMMSMGRSITLEKHYALSDIPITILYKELDQAYPGSKFILTIRDENDWIKSVERHWDSENNLQKKNWNKDPFTHFIHKQIYGQKNFDKEVFLERYRKHNFDVMEYFRGRNDLFILDLSKTDLFNELSSFLQVSVPTVPYPRSNES